MQAKRLSLLIWLSICLISQVACQKAPDIDQVGGTKLIYKLDQTEGEVDALDAEKTMQRRLDPLGMDGIQVRVVDGEMEIAIPNGKLKVDEVKRSAESRGSLAFLVVGDRQDNRLVRSVEAATDSAEREIKLQGEVVAEWYPVAKHPDGAAMAQFGGDDFVRELEDGSIEVALKRLSLTLEGRHLKAASKGEDSLSKPALNLLMTEEGAKRLRALTQANVGKRLAILFDDEIVSAPTINSAIGERAQVTGNLTERDIDLMVSILRCGEFSFQFVDGPPTVEQVSVR